MKLQIGYFLYKNNGLFLSGVTLMIGLFAAAFLPGPVFGQTDGGGDGHLFGSIKSDGPSGRENDLQPLSGSSVSIQPVKLGPQGQLLDAATGDGSIGVLFSRDEVVYYTEYHPDGEWSPERMIGHGTEGRLVMDGEDRPHVVFTTEEGEIGYTRREGADWDPIKLIASRHEGICYRPHLDVDSNNQPHITYTDSMGDTAGTTNQPDIMYAYLDDDAFVIELIYSGFYDRNWRMGTYYEKGSFIAIDENDNMYILTQRRNYDHGWQVFHSRSIFVEGSNRETLGSIGSNQNRFDIFGLKIVGDYLYALYRNDSELFVSRMTVNEVGDITGRVTPVAFDGSHAHSFEIVGDDIVVGSKSGDTLRVQHNDSTESFSEIEVLGSAVSVARLNDVFYVLYTDPNQPVTVTFEPEGGTEPVPPEIQVYPESSYGELAMTVRDGHTFDGWWTEPDGGGTRVTETTVVSMDEDHSLYAGWILNEYLLEYTAGQGGIIEGPVSQTVAHGNEGVMVNAVPETGWFFAQWSDGVTTAERQELAVTEDLDVTAEFARLEILQHPRNQTITKNSPATFTVTAEGFPSLHYQWECSQDDGNTWTVLEESNDSSYETGSVELSMTGNLYRVVVSHDFGEIISNSALLTVMPLEPVFEDIPGFGQVEVLQQDNRYRSVVYGELAFADGGADRSSAFSHSLLDTLYVVNGTVYSPHYGTLTPNPWGVDDWVVSEFFGLVHFGRDAALYDGWVNSERFDWMKFVEDAGGNRYLWVHHLQTWLVVYPDGSFYSFDFGGFIPQEGSLSRYNTRIGMVTVDFDHPQGWLASDDFGFVWFARDGSATWFWSEARQEWIGITEDGGLWSTAEGRFLP
jgi:uncharacterized repeat protein (TIGR02543 family)